MTWVLSQSEKDRAMSLGNADKYAYAVNKIRKHGELWSLKSADGWVLGVDPDGNAVFPIWPHEGYARDAATGAWQDSSPECISLDDWKNVSITVLEEYHAILGVMTSPGPEGRWLAVPVNSFTSDVADEERDYYKPK